MDASGLLKWSESMKRRLQNEVEWTIGRGMANHRLVQGVYHQSKWWTYTKSLEDSESVEKATFRNLWAMEDTNYDSQKSHFEEFVRALPDLCLLL